MYGFDIETLQVYPPTWKDIMSYCQPEVDFGLHVDENS